MALAIPAMLGAFALWLLGRGGRSSGAGSSSSDDPTAALRDLAESVPSSPVRAAIDEALTSASADAGSAYGTPAQMAALERDMVAVSRSPAGESVARVALEPSSSSPAPSSPAPLAPLAPLVTATTAPAANAEQAARSLHAYIMRVPSSSRDRALIRGWQTALGVRADGLIGRETAGRIRELTGLRIPGLS